MFYDSAGWSVHSIGIQLSVEMLTDMIVEEEFELKDEEPWYGKQDLEHGKRLVLRALKGGIACVLNSRS